MAVTDPAPPVTAQTPVMRFVARVPATSSIIALLLICGVATGALWSPFTGHALWNTLAYGVPALEAGRWWTPVTGTFFILHPLAYPTTILTFVGMAWLEWKRGSLVALAYFSIGQLFAVLATSLLLVVLSWTGWPWAVAEAAMLDVGPSGGTFACLAAAIALLAQPWRVRAWVALIAYVFVTLLFWGGIAELEHLLAVVLILVVDRSLRPRRTTMREQRLLAFSGLVLIGLVELISLLIPTDGPFGASQPAAASWIDIAFDLVIILVVGNAVRRGKHWAWVVALILAIVNTLGTVLGVALIALVEDGAVRATVESAAAAALATSLLWALMLVYLIGVRASFTARRRSVLGDQPAPTVIDVRDELHRTGGGTLSWMTTWSDLSYMRTTGGIVAYQKHHGVALALADPLGPADSRAESVREFIHESERAGLVPCFFSSSEATRDALPGTWREIVVADDSIVDLPGLAFTGKRWGSVRTSLNKAGREGMTFRLSHLKDEPWGIQQQLRAISEMWVGDKGLPEMGFTLGTLDEAEDPEVRLALAISPEGNVDGFLSSLPVYGDSGVIHGWTLDLMRRRDGGFGPVMEYLIGTSAAQFRDEGAQIMSLSGAPARSRLPRRCRTDLRAQRQARRGARTGVRLPLVAQVQGEIPPALRDDVSALPRRIRPCARRTCTGESIPTRRHDPAVRRCGLRDGAR